METLLNTFTHMTAFGAPALTVVTARMRDRIVPSCAASGKAEQAYGPNAGDSRALVARYLR